MRITLVFILFVAWIPGLNAQYLHHELHASINHSNNEIKVNDTLVFPAGFMDEHASLSFSLNKKLSLETPARGVKIEQLNTSEDPKSFHYRITLKSKGKDETKIPLRYKGILNEEIVTGAAEYARGFSETDGLIGDDGIYLAGSTAWIPAFEKAALFTFSLTVELDEPWNVVSQGTRSKNEVFNGRRIIQYVSSDPMDEMFLVAGQWTEYSLQSGDVLVQAFLRTPDESLANRYLGVTSHYLELYNNMIGAYPYTKFALVENFWETGYGMPSFTLLGEKVIRFPWILHSSYPHELLHNYWGNSVFVDYSRGNWCEGITAYMADHLIKEQQGLASDYRRNTLQKFTDYVNDENDFPPAGFISRNNPAEEAIGYGKVLMFNNMLRVEFGDEVFISAYADFYEHNKFRFASFEDIRASFEKVTQKNLKPLFDQWINRKGAPSLVLSDVQVSQTGSQHKLTFSLNQVQKGALFTLNVPVAIYLDNQEKVHLSRVFLEESSTTYSYKFDSRPLKISIDPQFNLMRKLHRSEVPSTLSQLFGAKEAVIIVPEKGPLSAEYKIMAGFWKETQAAQGKELKVIFDSELDDLPSHMPAWVLGFENRFYKQVKIGEQYSDLLSSEDKGKIAALKEEHSLVYAIPKSNDPGITIGFIGTRNADALKGLSRKLFHYGSYGYLGFEGDAPDNVLKGVFPVLNSQLDHVVDYADDPEIWQILSERKALTSK